MIAKLWYWLNLVVNTVASYLADVVLLVIRLYWGYQFFLTGKGKLANLDQVAEYFASLQLPAPKFQAALAGTTECVGGLFLLVGLLSRLTTIPLMVTMVVAYLAADKEAFFGLFGDADSFFKAAPFLFLYASVIVFCFGPGRLSADQALKYAFRGRNDQKL